MRDTVIFVVFLALISAAMFALVFFWDALRAVIALRLVLQLERVPCLPQ